MYIFKKLKPKYKILLLTSMMALFAVSCNEVFEQDIAGKSVSIISPADGYSSPSNQVVFWWNKLDGADWYNLQIVKPSFSNVQTLIVDTNVVGESFSWLLSFGEYEWRIRPENSAYIGDYVVRSFSVESDSDLTYQVVPLTSPVQYDTTNNLNQSFSWQSIPYTESYTFTIWQNAYGGTTEHSSSVTTNNANYTFVTDGAYEWGVKAVNALTSSIYYTRKIYIDTQSPATPVLLLPAEDDTLTTTSITFSWTHSSGGSSITDSLLVSDDNGFANIVFSTATKASEVTTILSAGIYYWKVKSVDAAGNESSYSSYRTVTIE